jgi:hypothetical protein
MGRAFACGHPGASRALKRERRLRASISDSIRRGSGSPVGPQRAHYLDALSVVPHRRLLRRTCYAGVRAAIRSGQPTREMRIEGQVTRKRATCTRSESPSAGCVSERPHGSNVHARRRTSQTTTVREPRTGSLPSRRERHRHRQIRHHIVAVVSSPRSKRAGTCRTSGAASANCRIAVAIPPPSRVVRCKTRMRT